MPSWSKAVTAVSRLQKPCTAASSMHGGGWSCTPTRRVSPVPSRLAGGGRGLAVVPGGKGQVDEAVRGYDMAAARADADYPQLARRVRERSSTSSEFAEPITLPTQAELPTPAIPDRLVPTTIDESLRDLLLPDEPGAS